MLAATLPHHSRIRDTLNEQRNTSELPDARARLSIKQVDQSNRQALDHIIANTDPDDESSLVQAITDFNELEHIHDLKDGFFAALREKLSYPKRGDYLRNICALEHLFYHWKFAELKQAKAAWSSSSAGLNAVFRSLAVPLIGLHADDLISHDRVSRSSIKEISELTGVPHGRPSRRTH